MGTRKVTCYIPVCDLCGGTDVDEGEFISTPHAVSREEAIACVTDDDQAGWVLTPDGLLVCDTMCDAAHETALAQAGKELSRHSRIIPPPSTWWPTADEAYADAPGIPAETTELFDPTDDELPVSPRIWEVRHAAVLDRVALDADPVGTGPESRKATRAAVTLLALDRHPDAPHGARAYVRQQYALMAAGRSA
ncbi:hypothetical protein [Streptomyces sp. NRRL S-1868]|uniref:hypothetical protein n=1 Tax=Streptomyces sp. NRRL S-1868 TaxID=1463892 RepID=UPI0007C6ABB0|nr:hypothetical protein [Streptomyces sp. NRRL S-1868]